MRLLLIRHGESTWNATNRWQGQSDVPLSPRGHIQVRAVAARLFGVHFDRRVASDLSRAWETATAIGGAVDPEPAFREIDVGDWAGLKRSEVEARYPAEVAALKDGQPVSIGGGESMPEFEDRVDRAFDRLVAECVDQSVLVITHGGVIRAIVTRLLGLRGRRSPLDGSANTALTVLTVGQRLRRYNDVGHLSAADQGSGLTRLPAENTQVMLVADAGLDASSTILEGLQMRLGVAESFVAGDAQGGALARALLAEPLGDGFGVADLEAMCAARPMGAFAVVLPPATIRSLLAERLELPAPRSAEVLAGPAHGSLTTLRVNARSTTLHGYGVAVGGDAL